MARAIAATSFATSAMRMGGSPQPSSCGGQRLVTVASSSRIKKVSYPAPINEGAEYAYYFSQSGTLWETFGVCAFVRMGETTGQEDSSMRTSILAMIVAFGT